MRGSNAAGIAAGTPRSTAVGGTASALLSLRDTDESRDDDTGPILVGYRLRSATRTTIDRPAPRSP